jgi:hypothetical protein
LTAIYKAPGEQPEIIEIPNTLEALQEKVGGYIETVPFAPDACIICNEEGRLMGLPNNCWLLGVHFVGPILIVGVDGDGFCDMPVDMVNMFRFVGEAMA